MLAVMLLSGAVWLYLMQSASVLVSCLMFQQHVYSKHISSFIMKASRLAVCCDNVMLAQVEAFICITRRQSCPSKQRIDVVHVLAT